MIKTRYLQKEIQTLCLPGHKMAFVSGPRQAGKTTMAKKLLKARGTGAYLNWDEKSFRQAWAKQPLAVIEAVCRQDGPVPMVVLDEIHKAKGWKRNLKGVYDSLTQPVDIIVTGSAKLNVYRRGSDSLLGRYHHFRLYGFSLAELLKTKALLPPESLCTALLESSTHKDQDLVEQLLHFGPFPEPLLLHNQRQLNLWHRERVERLVREDLRDLSRIQELSQIEMLVALLPERASGVLSITSLKEDLECAYKTMKLWLDYLKHVYYIFEIKPYATSIPRALKKEGKLYLYDWSEIKEDGHRFENMVAMHLLKYVHYLCDTGIADVKLHYLKNREKKEIDFLLVKDNIPWLPIEVKLSDTALSKNWVTYFKHLPCKFGVQLVKQAGVKKLISVGEGEVLIISVAEFLRLLV